MNVDPPKVADLIREAAATEIMPRYQSLAEHHIEEKAPGDLVTVADHAAEAMLERGLRDLLPGSAVIGEEAAHRTPQVLHALGGDDPVWIVDPIDGTSQFASGEPYFGVMVALVRRRETVLAWIHIPVDGRLITAEHGGGSFLGETRLKLPAPPPIGEMYGAVLTKYLPEDLRPAAARALVSFGDIANERCAAWCYAEFVQARTHFALYHRTLVWDHAPGALIATEAGGIVARYNGRPYAPEHDKKGLLIAPDGQSWHRLHDMLLPSVEISADTDWMFR